MLSVEDGRMPHPERRLAECIARRAWQEGDFETAIPALSLNRRNAPSPLISSVYRPSVAFIVQGKTRIVLGNEEYVCGPGKHLITAVDLPTVHQILEATPQRPFLSLLLTLDLQTIAQTLVESELLTTSLPPFGHGMLVSAPSPALLDAVSRLVALLDEPEHIPALAPLVQREILYRLLTGDQGQHLRQIALVGSQSHRIAKAIALLKTDFMRSQRMECIAEAVSMGLSTFNHHFRTLTSMSPLQYQKQLRLHEARRLMLVEHLDAASAAHHVGYESPSQFSREYRRLFGAPPLRDLSKLKKYLGGD